MSEICQPCQAHEERTQRGLPAGTYRLTCVRCCARLVRSARPLLAAQEAMLAVIALRPGRPTREQVIAAIHQLDLVAEQAKNEGRQWRGKAIEHLRSDAKPEHHP